MQGGYGYVLAITEAIERWSAAEVRGRPNAFFHRRANLRYAVERSLFFELVNDVTLRARFDATGDVEFKIPPFGLRRRLKSELGNLSRLLRPSFTTAKLHAKSKFLFLTIDPKFVIFLKPIADAFGADAAYLTVHDKATEEYLRKRDLPLVAVRRAFTPCFVPLRTDHYRFSVSRAFDQVSAMMEKLKPSVIVVPEGNAPIYEVAHRAGLQHGVATVSIQHGGPGYANPGFRNWTFSDAIVWGPKFIPLFSRFSSQQKFSAVGTPAMLGATRRRHREPVTTVGFFLQKGTNIIPADEWEMMLTLIGWLAESFPDIEVLVREHPTQPPLDRADLARLGSRPNLRLVPTPKFSLGAVLCRCDVVVAAASTTLLEAVAVGAIPFILGTAYPSDFPAMTAEGAAISAATLAAAKGAMARIIADADWRESLRDAGECLRPELFASVGQDATARIVAHLRNIATNTQR